MCIFFVLIHKRTSTHIDQLGFVYKIAQKPAPNS